MKRYLLTIALALLSVQPVQATSLHKQWTVPQGPRFALALLVLQPLQTTKAKSIPNKSLPALTIDQPRIFSKAKIGDLATYIQSADKKKFLIVSYKRKIYHIEFRPGGEEEKMKTALQIKVSYTNLGPSPFSAVVICFSFDKSFENWIYSTYTGNQLARINHEVHSHKV